MAGLGCRISGVACPVGQFLGRGVTGDPALCREAGGPGDRVAEDHIPAQRCFVVADRWSVEKDCLLL